MRANIGVDLSLSPPKAPVPVGAVGPIMTSLLAAHAVVFSLLASAIVTEAQGCLDQAKLAFLRVRETIPQHVREVCGEPWLEYDTNVFEGEIDPFVHMDEVEHYIWQRRKSEKTGKKLVEVHVLEYRNASAMSQYTKMVFQDGKLWYALMPPTLAESTVAWIKLRYGQNPTVQEIPVQSYDIRYTATIWWYRDLGIAYFWDIGPKIDAKIVFPREKE